MEHIRNFCIIAHIDHGKSNLLIVCLNIPTHYQREGTGQLLDDMDWSGREGSLLKAMHTDGL